MARDINELKQTQREMAAAREALAVELRELEVNRRQLVNSEDKLRKVLAATGDAITINRLKDGHYLDVNQAFCDLTGYTREESLERSAIEMGLWHDPVQLRQLLHLLKTEGRARNLECTFRIKDGCLVEHLVSASLIRLDGETCIVSATRDVSELKRTERELRAVREALSAEVHELEASQARLRSEIAERESAQRRVQQSERTLRRILDASLDAMTIRRLSDGRYIEVNKAFEATCYTRDEALGKTAEELGLWVDPNKFRLYLERLKTQGQVRNMEFEFRARDGRFIPGLVSAVVVELGGEPCVVSIARDISELKQTERELIAAREALSAEVRQLEASQVSLRSEIAERELAQRRLQESEQTLRKMFETSLDSIAINRLSDGRFIAVNDEYLRITGHRREEVLASTGAELKAFVKRERMHEMFARLRADGFVRNFEIDLRTAMAASFRTSSRPLWPT
jgi:PAS domain S-box-containing protein